MFNILFVQTFAFVVNVLASFTFLAGGWLYIDSWKIKKRVRTTFYRAIGFFMVSLAYLVTASQLNVLLITQISDSLRVIGYFVIFTSLLAEPILSSPSKKTVKLGSFWTLPILKSIITPLAIGGVGLMYFIKSTKGLEKQLKPAAVAFGTLFVSEILKTSTIFSGTKIVFWSKLLGEYGALWLATNFLELIGIAILFAWIWGYLRFRVQPQIFITTLGFTIIVFVTVAVSFSFLTLKNLERDLITSLQTNSRLFQYTIERLQLEALASAKTIASDNQVITNLPTENAEKLTDVINSISTSQKLDIASVINTNGFTVASLNDSEVDVDESQNPVVASSLKDTPLSTISVRSGSLYPEIAVSGTSPVVSNNGEILGVTKCGYIIDSAFIDGIKEVTQLDASIYAGSTQVASTLTIDDGITRYVGVKETNKDIIDQVLGKGQEYTGKNTILNSSYYVAYQPIKALNNQVIGMISVIRPQSVLSDNIKNALNSTFLVSVILIALSIVPTYYLAKYIERNITA